jgi:dual-specificity kinase
MCLYDFLKDNDFAPFPRQHIQSFARQLLGSVACKYPFDALISFDSNYPSLVLHDLHLIHTDLKPENILLVHNDYKTVHVPVPGKVILIQFYFRPSSNYVIVSQRNAPTKAKRILHSTDIRLIDFGSATFENEYHSTVVCTRHYRAPEIILGRFLLRPQSFDIP